MTAFLDGPDSPDISNPIHSTKVAGEYGFKAALVGGVTVYGWATPPILEVLSDRWLSNGWVDAAFRAPVYPGDELTIRAERAEDGAATWAIVNPEGVACVAGTAGLGEAPWLNDLQTTTRLAAEPRPATLPTLTMEIAPIGQGLRPMAVPITIEEMEAYADGKQLDPDPRWRGSEALLHPGWIAGRMTPLLHHSFEYGPAIHTRSQIQHLAPARAGQTLTVAGRFIEAFERKGNQYAVLDGTYLGEDGTVFARARHTTIFNVRKMQR
jgi:acyl dehydratase